MYSRFNVKLNSTDFLKDYYEIGRTVLQDNKIKLRDALDFYTDGNGTIDGGKLQEDWFSTIPVDIFISHSHKDVNIAISLAGWLHKELGLSSFVDSCLWGYIGDLLAEINDEYNFIRTEPNGTKTYKHKGVINASTHVDAMLSMSLNKMLDNSEAIFFLNTDNSVTTSKNFPDRPGTYSPWIYSEICLTNTMRQKKPARKSNIRLDESTQQLLIHYPIDISSFYPLSNHTLNIWCNIHSTYPEYNSMDILYQIIDEYREQ